MEEKKYRQSLHTHCTFCDGKDDPEDVVCAAIEKGFTDIGFSSHGYNQPIDVCSLDDEREIAYIETIRHLKKKYAGRINVWLGIEEDLMGRVYDLAGFDYIITSVHFVPSKDGMTPVDYDEATARKLINESYDGDFLAYARAYYDEVARIASRPEADIVGHVDLLMKYNEAGKMFDFDDPKYLELAFSAIDKLIAAGKIFEVNTGAISRGYRSDPYPHITLLKYIHDHGGRITLTSDCHDCAKLDCAYPHALDIIRSAGFDTVYVFDSGQFLPVSVSRLIV